MKVKARKSQERKALKLRVHDGGVVGLVHITIKRKDMYHDFTDEVAIALGSLPIPVMTTRRFIRDLR